MNKYPDRLVSRRRKLLQNPYAYLNGVGNYDSGALLRPLRGRDGIRFELQNPWAHLDGDGKFSDDVAKLNQQPRCLKHIEVRQLLGRKRQDENFSRADIESIVRQLQGELWRRATAEMSATRKALDPVDVLDPIAALNSVGYTIEDHESLGQSIGDDDRFEVAGVLDRAAATVHISRHFSRQVRNFTTAHELGHVVLHADTGMHRDRALDGGFAGRNRDSKEAEADMFAAFFLLPEKPLRLAFKKRFLTDNFVLNDATTFALTFGSLHQLRRKCRSLRDLTRMLANAEQYNGAYFYSLANYFGVSIEAMAIRLEELLLVEE